MKLLHWYVALNTIIPDIISIISDDNTTIISNNNNTIIPDTIHSFLTSTACSRLCGYRRCCRTQAPPRR